MTESPTINDEIERYLRTGKSDPLYAAWSGGFMERAKRAHEDLRGALVCTVRLRTEGLTHPPLPEGDTVSLTRAKVEPMVRDLFPQAEQDVVLATIERSVVFVTSANIETLLLKRDFDHSAWTLANLYLASLGAQLLGEDAPHLVGISEETTCFVSPEYFAEDDPFADFIVHFDALWNEAVVALGMRLKQDGLEPIDFHVHDLRRSAHYQMRKAGIDSENSASNHGAQNRRDGRSLYDH